MDILCPFCFKTKITKIKYMYPILLLKKMFCWEKACYIQNVIRNGCAPTNTNLQSLADISAFHQVR